MDIEPVQARIAHESAELRAGYPHITDCGTLLVQWDEAGRKRYARQRSHAAARSCRAEGAFLIEINSGRRGGRIFDSGLHFRSAR
jgi:hypothetical protein